MEVKIDLMTKEEMLQESYNNKGNKYTTEEWQENGDYVTTDRNGYLNYANGEEVIDNNEEEMNLNNHKDNNNEISKINKKI